MKRFSMIFVSCVLTFAIFFSSLPLALACGPFTVDPLFSFTRHLDYPLENYTNDKIGVVPQTFGRISLFVYYRQLNNLPFTTNEKAQITQAIEKRIGTHFSENSEAETKPETTTEPTVDKNSGVEKWKTARAKITGSNTKTDIDKKISDDYSSYANCLDDAYSNAANALEARITKYGNNESVKEWLNGQDSVFSNCGENGKVPANVADNSPDWLKKDRQYQIAAALFYNEKYPESRKIFATIANDNNSVWKNTAKFVVARTFIRQASSIDETSPDYEAEKTSNVNANTSYNTAANAASNAAIATGLAANSSYTSNMSRANPAPKADPKIIKTADAKKVEKVELYKKAEMQLQAVLSDSAEKDFHESAHRLLNLVRYRGNPKQQREILAERLAQSGENSNIFNDLTDYVWLLDKVESEAREKGIEREQKAAEQTKKDYDYDYTLKLQDIDKTEMSKDLTDWLYSYQATDSFNHSYAKWKETKKLAWFVAAISKAQRNSTQISELLSEAEKIQPNSPAYPTVRYHQIQLLLETDKRAEAKQKLNEVLNGNFKNYSRSTQNKFLAQRMTLAENLEDFLKYSQRQAATFVWSDDANEQGDDFKDDKIHSPWLNRTMFDEDAVAFFNEKMPLSVLRQAALSPNLPEHLKKFLVIAVWTRAFVLQNQAVESEFAPLVSKYAKDYAQFSRLSNTMNPTDRESIVLQAVLNNPAIQPYVPVGIGRDDGSPADIDSIRGNWWCVVDEKSDEYSRYDHYKFEYPKAYPNFLTPAQTAEATRERQQLLATGNSATLLAQRALDFATKNPAHPNTPEILHLAVRSTRYGCTDDNTLKISKADFDFLHKRFPNNDWTKKTPYYFGKR